MQQDETTTPISTDTATTETVVTEATETPKEEGEAVTV